MGQFLTITRDYARKNGFTGKFFGRLNLAWIAKHQYDFDSNCNPVLEEYGLETISCLDTWSIKPCYFGWTHVPTRITGGVDNNMLEVWMLTVVITKTDGILTNS